MSHPMNVQYTEGALELFNECVDSHDYPGAKIVIAQLYRDGFETEARDLEKQLLDSPLSAFVVSLNVQSL